MTPPGNVSPSLSASPSPVSPKLTGISGGGSPSQVRAQEEVSGKRSSISEIPSTTAVDPQEDPESPAAAANESKTRTIPSGGSGDGGVEEAGEEDDSVYEWTKEIMVRTPKLLEALLGTGLVSVKGGWSHAIAVTDFGAVVGMGSHPGNGLGFDALERPVTIQPQKKKSSSSKSSSGAGGTGGGTPVRSPLFSEPIPLSGAQLYSGVHIVTISCGSFHSLALDQDGRIFSWGSNLMGQLGQGHRLDVNHPSLIQLPKER